MNTLTQQEIVAQIEPILKRYNVPKAALFGSVVSGESNEQSDVDILVEMPVGSTLFDLSALSSELKEELGREVDVVTFNSVNPNRRQYILENQVSIYG